MNRNNITKLALSIVFICFLLSTFVSLCSLQLMVSRNMQELSKAVTSQIYDTINGELSEPIAVSRTMANDRFLIETLEKETSMETDEVQKMIAEYLTRLHEGLSYQSAFVVSDATKRYYSYSGLGKTMDVKNNPRDAWYTAFTKEDLPYDLDVDRDETQADELTIFVNAKIHNDDSRMLGVCGVGIHMMKSLELVYELEKEYEVKINLIDKDGLIQTDTDQSQIKSGYITDVKTRENDEYVYERRHWGHYVVTKYLDRLGWFLVVRSNGNSQMLRFFNIIILNVILCILVMIILVFSIRIIMERTTALAHASFRDQSTSLLNRRAFEEEKARLASTGMDENFIYLTADLNGLKAVNDQLGHAAGDELIKGAAHCLKASLSTYGHIYRIGGDEFAATLIATPEQLSEAIDRLEKLSAAWTGEKINGLSISLGHASCKEFPSENISEIIRISDERMYAAKAEYYRRTGKDRRKA